MNQETSEAQNCTCAKYGERWNPQVHGWPCPIHGRRASPGPAAVSEEDHSQGYWANSSAIKSKAPANMRRELSNSNWWLRFYMVSALIGWGFAVALLAGVQP